MTPTTFAVWAAPFVLLALGALVFWRILAARTNQPLDEEPPP
jgi:cytochrome c-type biogenesis protein CcmH/NrfF